MNKNVNFTFLLIVIVALSAIGQVPANGLVGYWPFNGNADDASGNGNHGTVSGATLTTDRFGNANSAYSFNSSSSNYIEIPDNALLRPGQITISLWVNSSVVFLPRAQAVLVKTNISNAQNEQYAIAIRPNGSYNYPDFALKFNSSCQPGAGWVSAANANTASTVNNWHHFVGIFNGDSLMLYHDNVLSAIDLRTGAIDDCPGGTLNIGRNWSQFPDYFQGSIDDIRIYNRAFSEAEVAELYNEGICELSVSVTDTLIINVNLTGFDPVSYQHNIKIYANPSNDLIIIDCGSNYTTLNGYTIKITNSLGQIVNEFPVTQQTETIDLNSWTGKGIYFVYLVDGSSNTVDVKKIILQ